jgi:hypothetical protein
LGNGDGKQKTALVTSPAFPEVQLELGLIKALELAGFTPVVLIPDKLNKRKLIFEYYELAAVKEIHFWSEFVDPLDFAGAESVLQKRRTLDELLAFEYAGARAGRLAVSTALRTHRLGYLDPQASEDRRILVDHLASAMAYAKAAQKIVEKFDPALALFVDTVYTPEGELFDNCLKNGINTMSWQAAHKSGAVIFKRYTIETRDRFPKSLSSESWQQVRDMEWTDLHRDQLERELYSNYASGDWYSVVSTQVNKRLMDAEKIRKQLGLDAAKKTAFIFPHIVWDGTLFWGSCLFRNFEEWCIEAIRAACANDKVNWVIKIHPANKRLRETTGAESAEVRAVREHIGELPPHVSMIPAESDVSTFSLFQVMDYCLTVCGTVGIEAARLGIPVLTGGRGFYDRRGFTVDSESPEQYLQRIASIDEIPRLSHSQQELAERFAYGLFLLRPCPMTTISLHYSKNEKEFSARCEVNIETEEEWYSAADIKAIAQWVTDTRKRDFLVPPT